MSCRKLLQWRTSSRQSVVCRYATFNTTGGRFLSSHGRTENHGASRRNDKSSGSRFQGSNSLRDTWPSGSPEGKSLTSSRTDNAIDQATEGGLVGQPVDSPEPEYEKGLLAQPALSSTSTKAERNSFYRKAFSNYNTEEKLRERLQNSPLVPSQRQYPIASMTAVSLREARKAATANIGFGLIWDQHRARDLPTFDDTLALLKLMSAPKEQGGLAKVSAIRVVLPFSPNMTLRSERVRFVDSVTGLLSGLRVLPHHQDAASIILRGEDTILRTATGEFIKSVPNVKILELGNVSALDYEAKRVWPTIEISPPEADGTEQKLFGMKFEGSWEPIIIKHPFEEFAMPQEWTAENFESYLTQLIRSRLPSDLVMKLYERDGRDGRLVDVNKTKIKLIKDAITDPAARPYITPSTFNMALEFIAHAGGHIAQADKLFTLAEEWGIPLDTSSFNVMLRGYAKNRNIGLFYSFLRKMKARWFKPDAQTWLCFLELVGKDDARRRVSAAMHQLGYVDDVATRRGIARIMAAADAYSAFRSGKTMAAYLQTQQKLYGDHWFSFRAAPDILTQYLAFSERDLHATPLAIYENIQILLNQPSWDNSSPGADFFNAILSFAAHARSWPLALYAMRQSRAHAADLSASSYAHLINLAIHSQSPHALSVVFFHCVFQRKLKTASRQTILRLFQKSSETWWGRMKPRLMTMEMAQAFKQRKTKYDAAPVNEEAASTPSTAGRGGLGAVEWAILSTLERSGITGFDESLEDALERALSLDLAFRSDLEQPKKAPGDKVRPSSVEVKMKNEQGKHVTLLLSKYVDLSPARLSKPLEAPNRNKETNKSSASTAKSRGGKHSKPSMGHSQERSGDSSQGVTKTKRTRDERHAENGTSTPHDSIDSKSVSVVNETEEGSR